MAGARRAAALGDRGGLLRIDLNADVGEGYDDRSLMPFLTSVNVACGGHAGDARSMADTVAAAYRLGLVIGAHPSYPDREHFGRREIVLPPAELEASIVDQIAALERVAKVEGARLDHVKPHGALYNRAARDLELARVVARAVRAVSSRLKVVGLCGSALLEAAREIGLPALAEAFADRRYAADGSLAPRTLAGSLIEDPAEAADQALHIVQQGELVSIDGARVALSADTLCVHSDTPGASAIARAVRERLREAGVEVVAHPSSGQ